MLARPVGNLGTGCLPDTFVPQYILERTVQVLHPMRLAVQIRMQTNCHDPPAFFAFRVKHIEGITNHAFEFFTFGLIAIQDGVVDLHGVGHTDQIAMWCSDRHWLVVVW